MKRLLLKVVAMAAHLVLVAVSVFLVYEGLLGPVPALLLFLLWMLVLRILPPDTPE